MENLWAPWRRQYIEEGPPRGCIFCDKAAAGNDAASHIVARSETCFSMLNRFPYNGGHLMVAPFRHVSGLDGLGPRELAGLIMLVRDSIALLSERLRPDGYNVGINLGSAAGAGVVGHLHVHVVPRWNGDTNFMPVVAGAKVVPQALDEMYRLLTGA